MDERRPKLAASPRFEAIYHEDRVWVFEVVGHGSRVMKGLAMAAMEFV